MQEIEMMLELISRGLGKVNASIMILSVAINIWCCCIALMFLRIAKAIEEINETLKQRLS